MHKYGIPTTSKKEPVLRILLAQPDSPATFVLLKMAPKHRLSEAIAANLAGARALHAFVAAQRASVQQRMQFRLLRFEQEKADLETLITGQREMKRQQEEVISVTNNTINKYEVLREQKSTALARLDQELKRLAEEEAALQEATRSLIESELFPLTKLISESIVKELHTILTNEAKDEKITGVVRSLVCVLKNTLHIDYVTVNVKSHWFLIELPRPLRRPSATHALLQWKVPGPGYRGKARV